MNHHQLSKISLGIASTAGIPHHQHDFHQACVDALYKDDVNMYSTKFDLEEFLIEHNGAFANTGYNMKFEHLSPVVQFNFARATCGGEFPSTQVCSGAGARIDPTEHIAIPAGNEEAVQSLCADLGQLMLLEQLGLLEMSSSSVTQTQPRVLQDDSASEMKSNDEIHTESDECECIHISTNPSHDYYDFGASCDQWDLGLNKNCMDIRGNTGALNRNPSWCYSYWCFVDRERCARPFTSVNDVNATSQLYLGFGDNFTDMDLKNIYMSYETCGNINHYDSVLVEKRAANYTLRYGIPGVSSDGYTLMTKDEDTGERGGSIVEFIYSTFTTSEFTIELTYKDISEKSFKKYGSNYSACVHDVAIGELDLCVGPFWVTAERVLMTPFTNSLFTDEFFLIVPIQDSDVSLWEQMSTPFKPFHNDAWLLIAIATLYMASSIRFMQIYTRNNTTNEEKNSFSFKSIGHAIYDGVNSITTGAATHVSETPIMPEKLVVSGFALFALLVLTAYTATSAASLVLKGAKHGTYKNLDAIADAGKNVCIRSEGSETFLGSYSDFFLFGNPYAPDGSSKVRPHTANDDTPMFKEVERGGEDDCVGVIIDAAGFEKLQTIDPGDSNGTNYCNYIRVGDVIISIMYALPVRPEYHSDLTYIIQNAVNKGEYEMQSQIAKKLYIGPAQCGDVNGNFGAGSTDEVTVYKAKDLVAVLSITFFMTTAGLVLCLYNVRKRRMKGLEHDENALNNEALAEEKRRDARVRGSKGDSRSVIEAPVCVERELTHNGSSRDDRDSSFVRLHSEDMPRYFSSIVRKYTQDDMRMPQTPYLSNGR